MVLQKMGIVTRLSSAVLVIFLFVFGYGCNNQKAVQRNLDFTSISSLETIIPVNPFTPVRSKGRNAEVYLKSNKRFGLDDKKVLTMNYRFAYNNAGVKHNPTFIATYASAFYQDYLDTGDIKFKNGLLAQVDWLIANKTVMTYNGENFWVWAFDFDLDDYRIKAPWWSGLSQGRIMTAVLAAYQVTRDQKYLDAIVYIYRPFLIPINQGGFATYTPKGTWYEEYTNKNAKSSKILNGHISALAALWTLWDVSKNKAVKESMETGIDAVVNNLDRFDSGATGILNQNTHRDKHFIGRLGYNTFHIYQLLWLYGIRRNSTFLKHALNFSRYDYPGYAYTALGSTDPVGHGPKNLNFEGYPKHWAHNRFPTWTEVDLKFIDVIHEIMIVGHSFKSAPKDFIIQSSVDRQKWELIGEYSNNSKIIFRTSFTPRSARYIRIIIKSDNGENNTGIAGIVIWQKYGNFSAISNFNNFSSHNSPQRMFKQKWKPAHPGWFILDLVSPNDNEVRLQVDKASDIHIQFSDSNDLTNFDLIKPITEEHMEQSRRFSVATNKRYLRCNFSKAGAIFSLKRIKAGNLRTWKSEN